MDPGVALQIEAWRSSLENLLARPDIRAGKLSEAFGGLGMLYLAYGLREAAEPCYRNARSLQPQEFRWSYYLGRVHRAQGQLDEALVDFQQALEIRPTDLPALVWAGEVRRDLNDLERARELYRKALEVDPYCAPALFGLGQVALKLGEFRTAVSRLESALERSPRSGRAHYALAMAYRGLGELDRAEHHLSLSGPGGIGFADPLMAEVQSLATGWRAHQRRAAAALAAGRFDVAAGEYSVAISVQPRDTQMRVNFGVALARLGDLEQARRQFAEALRISPDYTEASFQLGVLHTKQGDYAQAVERFRAVLRSDPEHLTASFNLASLLSATGRHGQAVEYYLRVLERDPGHAVGQRMLGVTLARLGRYEEALDRLERAHRAMPDQTGVAEALARLLAASPHDGLRDGGRALKLIREAARDGERDPERIETLAMAHAEVGDFPQAVRWQRRAIAVAAELGRRDLLPVFEHNLRLYERGEPCRAPWPQE